MCCRSGWFALALAAIIAAITGYSHSFGGDQGEKGQKPTDNGQAADAIKPGDGKPAEMGAELTAVERALDKRFAFKMQVCTPLRDAADYLSNLTGLNVLIDSKPIIDAGGAGAEMPVHFESADASLRTALRELTADHFLGYTVPADNVLLITSAEKAKETMVTRVYGLQHRDSEPSHDELGPASIEPDSDSLIDLIKSCIAPSSWSGNGGGGAITAYGATLVVTNRIDVQHEVAELLSALNRIRDAEKAKKIFPPVMLGSVPEDAKAAERLNVIENFDVHEMHFAQLVDFLKSKGLQAQLDMPRIIDAGGGPDTPLSFKAKQVPLKLALRTMLRERDLDYYMQDGIVVLTTTAACKDHVRTGIYPVLDLVEGDTRDRSELDFDSLIDTITSTISPTTWADGTGPGPIAPVGDPAVLVISQIDEVHEEISDLIDKIRTARRAAKSKFAADHQPDEKNAMTIQVHRVNPGTSDEGINEYIAAIRTLVEPKSWTDSGNYISRIPGGIIIRQKAAVQQRIGKLLAEMKQQGAAGAGGLGSGGQKGGAFVVP